MKKLMVVLALMAVVLTAACGGKGGVGPSPIPTAPTPAPTITVLGFKIWSNALCQSSGSIPCANGEVKANADGSFNLHGYSGGYFEGFAHFPSACQVNGQFWSDPAQSLLEASSEPVTGLVENVTVGDARFVKGTFDGRGPEDKRYANPATLHVRTTCNSSKVDADVVIHLVK